MRRALALLLMLATPIAASAAHRLSKQQRLEHLRHLQTIEQRIEAQKQTWRALQSRLHEKRAELNAAEANENYWQNQLSQTQAEIDVVQSSLAHTGAEQHETVRRLSWYTRQLSAAQRSLQLHDAMLRRRLVDVYEYGEPNFLSVLVAAKSFNDFVESWDDLDLLIAANERVVRDRKEAAQRVLAIQDGLEQNEVALQQEEQEQDQERAAYSSLAAEKANAVAIADQKRRTAKAEVDVMEDVSAQQEETLEALIQEKTREIDEAEGIAGPPIASNGYFSWPLTGPITSPFGWRENPFGGGPEFHQGLDIGVPVGTTVCAAAAGTVIMAQWYGGYGNYVLIDNGNHYSTGYGHLSAIYVSVGQVVKRGQAVAASGNTGDSTGPHLHFEIRYYGKPIDPAPRLVH